MSKESDAAIGIALGILGGAIAAWLLSQKDKNKSTCPWCSATVQRGPNNITTCPSCRAQLRWK